MKYTTKLLSCLCVFLASLQSPARSDFQHTPGKSSVIVLQGEVTVDGQQRPDLGRSFADTITGGLLKTKAYSVIDHLSNQPVAKAIEESPVLAPEQSAVAIGKELGARWIFVPRLIVEGEFNKLTLKKIRVSDGQAVEVFETHAVGDRSTMFLLIGEALKDIYTSTARDPSRLGKTSTGEPLPVREPEGLDPTPVGGSYKTVPDPIKNSPSVGIKKPGPAKETRVASAGGRGIPEGLKLGASASVTTEEKSEKPKAKKPAKVEKEKGAEEKPPTKIKDHATETEDKFARYMGTISTVNPDWRFCILKLRTTKEIKVGDVLSVKTGTIVPLEATLEVTKIEGNQAVADLVDGADVKAIKVGQTFYQWTEK